MDSVCLVHVDACPAFCVLRGNADVIGLHPAVYIVRVLLGGVWTASGYHSRKQPMTRCPLLLTAFDFAPNYNVP